MNIFGPFRSQYRERASGRDPGQSGDPQPAMLPQPDRAEGHVGQHRAEEEDGQDPGSPLLEDAVHRGFSVRPGRNSPLKQADSSRGKPRRNFKGSRWIGTVAVQERSDTAAEAWSGSSSAVL